MEIRLLEDSERGEGLELVWDVFLRRDAMHYSRECIDAFGYAIHDPLYVRELKIYGAFEKEELLGVIATGDQGRRIEWFFVESEHTCKGIVKGMVDKVCGDCSAEEITVLASPLVEETYRRLGFESFGEKEERDGVVYLPMKRRVNS